jgi:translation elongation factor EF-1beta
MRKKEEIGDVSSIGLNKLEMMLQVEKEENEIKNWINKVQHVQRCRILNSHWGGYEEFYPL